MDILDGNVPIDIDWSWSAEPSSDASFPRSSRVIIESSDAIEADWQETLLLDIVPSKGIQSSFRLSDPLEEMIAQEKSGGVYLTFKDWKPVSK